MFCIDVKKLVRTERGIENLRLKLTLYKSECVGIKGKTGSGKTTFLKLISGILEPDSGLISMEDELWWQNGTVLPARKRRIGYCMQNGLLYNHMTVHKNILFSGASKEQTDELLNRMGMYAFRNSYPHTLSGGQKQRILLARTLAVKKPLYLFDEPMAGLDTETSWRMADIIKSVQTEYEASMIIVSHDNSILSSMTDRMLSMVNGRLYGINAGSRVCRGMLRVLDLSERRISV